MRQALQLAQKALDVANGKDGRSEAMEDILGSDMRTRVFGISWNFQLSIFQVLGLWSGTKTGRDLRHTLEFL